MDIELPIHVLNIDWHLNAVTFLIAPMQPWKRVNCFYGVIDNWIYKQGLNRQPQCPCVECTDAQGSELANEMPRFGYI